MNSTMAVGDHDFSKCSLIPSVLLEIDVPDNINGSWHRGQVHVAIKDATFQPSSPWRHAVEMERIMSERLEANPVLLLYTDGGPDHRCVNITSVLLSETLVPQGFVNQHMRVFRGSLPFLWYTDSFGCLICVSVTKLRYIGISQGNLLLYTSHAFTCTCTYLLIGLSEYKYSLRLLIIIIDTKLWQRIRLL